MDNKIQYTEPHAKVIKMESSHMLAGSTTGDMEDGKLDDFDDLFNSNSNHDNEDNE